MRAANCCADAICSVVIFLVAIPTLTMESASLRVARLNHAWAFTRSCVTSVLHTKKALRGTIARVLSNILANLLSIVRAKLLRRFLNPYMDQYSGRDIYSRNLVGTGLAEVLAKRRRLPRRQ